MIVGKPDGATGNLISTTGSTPDHLRSSSRGMIAVVRHITYQREVRAGVTVTVYSTLQEVREKGSPMPAGMLARRALG
ncbi:hypothetical protein [Catellatospora sichuanensis]|uniref:hypothetical protein n=1 Tax=Catellatospora sichuanensis TaxID=1969805 RepID=UPI0011834038|nr:hypothetical protein [Catellatospora sichuanensis]